MDIIQHPRMATSGTRAKPVGIIVHDTAGGDRSDVMRVADYLVNGVRYRSGKFLRPPIYHYLVGHDGRVVQIAQSGRKANHAGRGERRVIDAMRTDDAVVPAATAGRFYANRLTIGVALARSGRHAVPPAQYGALVGLLRQLCRVNGWSEHRVVGHKEYTTRKVDPSRVDLHQLRANIASTTVKTERDQRSELVMPTLRLGHQSSHVSRVQQRLVHSWLLKQNDVDGSFGLKTERAVKQYQLVSWLVADGVVGPQTWRALTPPDSRG